MLCQNGPGKPLRTSEQSADTGTQQWWELAAPLASLQRRTGATGSVVGGTRTWQPKGRIWAKREDFNTRISAFPACTIFSALTPHWQRGFLQDLSSIYSIVYVSIQSWSMRAPGHKKQFRGCKSYRRASMVTNSWLTHEEMPYCTGKIHARNGLAYTLHPNSAPYTLCRLGMSGVEPWTLNLGLLNITEVQGKD